MRRFLWDDVVISPDRAADEVKLALNNAVHHGVGYWNIESNMARDLYGFCGFRFIDYGPEIELVYGLHRCESRRRVRMEARIIPKKPNHDSG